MRTLNRYRTEKKLARGLCVPFVDISLRTSLYSAFHFSTEIRAREFAWPLKRHKVLPSVKLKISGRYLISLRKSATSNESPFENLDRFRNDELFELIDFEKAEFE